MIPIINAAYCHSRVGVGAGYIIVRVGIEINKELLMSSASLRLVIPRLPRCLLQLLQTTELGFEHKAKTKKGRRSDPAVHTVYLIIYIAAYLSTYLLYISG